MLRRLHVLLVIALSSTESSAQVLPPPPRPPQTNNLTGSPKLLVQGFKFDGNRAFSDAELETVTAPFTSRELTTEDIEQARRAVTLHYINSGYINSGAVLPDQNPTNGIIQLRIVEGVLSEVDLVGNKWLRDGYITDRVERWGAAPLNINDLQQGLQLLRQNPNVRQINAELKPGTAPGESRLELRVEDQQPFRLGLQIDNQRPPSVGAEQFWLLASDLNLTGNNDPLDLKYGIANAGPHGIEWSRMDNLEGSYVLPFTPFDTTLGLQASRLNTSLIEEDFQELDIDSVTTSYGVALRQPVFQTANQEAAVSVRFDYRKNETWLLDEPFDLSPGAEDGEMVVSVLRVSQEWVQRGQNHVLALRSTFNLGLEVLEASDVAGPVPDADYFSWLGQGQYVQRLFKTQNQVVLRLAGQWTAEPLLALEQFSVGGMDTVRGYLENQLVRDRGIVGSVEFRLPVLFDKTGAGIVQVAPFFDAGGAWNVQDSSGLNTIYSIGTGLLVAPNRHFSAQLYWGYRLKEVDMPDDAGGQGLGLSFRIVIQAF